MALGILCISIPVVAVSNSLGLLCVSIADVVASIAVVLFPQQSSLLLLQLCCFYCRQGIVCFHRSCHCFHCIRAVSIAGGILCFFHRSVRCFHCSCRCFHCSRAVFIAGGILCFSIAVAAVSIRAGSIAGEIYFISMRGFQRRALGRVSEA